MRHYRQYSELDIKSAALEVRSLSQLLKKLGLRAAGGNFSNMKRLLNKHKINCEHWTGQAWNKGERLKDWAGYTRATHCKKHLIAARGHRCEQCGLNTWLERPISLEIHHEDGDRTNNLYKNLLLLCPNCHSFTDNFRGKKRLSAESENSLVERVKLGEPFTGNPEPSSLLEQSEGVETLRREPKSYICICGRPRNRRATVCRVCYNTDRPRARPPESQLITDFKQLKSFVKVGAKYNVSDNAVRKWVKAYKIEDTVKRKSSAQTDSSSLVVKTIA